MCIDYRVLNKLIMKNKYPMPLIVNLFDQLGGVWWFTKLDHGQGTIKCRLLRGTSQRWRV